MNLFYPELDVDRVGVSLHRAHLDAIRQGDLDTCLKSMRRELNGINLILSKLGHASPLTGVVSPTRSSSGRVDLQSR